MTITVNGHPRPVAPSATVASLLQPAPGMAVAVNGEVVRAADWSSHPLRDGDVVEIVTARQGG